PRTIRAPVGYQFQATTADKSRRFWFVSENGRHFECGGDHKSPNSILVFLNAIYWAADGQCAPHRSCGIVDRRCNTHDFIVVTTTASDDPVAGYRLELSHKFRAVLFCHYRLFDDGALFIGGK